MQVGTRVYYTGDAANHPAFGTIAEIHPANRWGGKTYRISLDDGREFDGTTTSGFEGVGRRWWLADEWEANQNRRILESVTERSGATATQVADALEPLVNDLLIKTARAELNRERVDAIKREILAGGAYFDSDGKQVFEPRYSWMIADRQWPTFFAACHAGYIEAGYAVEEGYCPALIAEHDQTKAEWTLITAAEQFVPGVTNDRLLCGTKEKNGLEIRREYLDLLCKIVVNRPGYRQPKLVA